MPTLVVQAAPVVHPAPAAVPGSHAGRHGGQHSHAGRGHCARGRQAGLQAQRCCEVHPEAFAEQGLLVTHQACCGCILSMLAQLLAMSETKQLK